MHPLTEMLRNMLEKGVDHETILMAVDGGLTQALSTRHPLDSRGDKQRKWDREYRQRKRAHQLDIHSNPLDIHSTEASAETSTSSATSKNLSSFSKVSKKEESKNLLEASSASSRVDKTNRGHRLPADWTPDDSDFANEILGEQRAATELDKFHNYWRSLPGARGLKLNWQLTWRNWVLKASEMRQSGGYRNGQRSGSLMDALDDLEQQIDREAETDFELPESNLLRLPLGSVR